MNYFKKIKIRSKSRICVLAENGNAGTEVYNYVINKHGALDHWGKELECVKLINLMKENPVVWLLTHASHGKQGARTVATKRITANFPRRDSLFFYSLYCYLISMTWHAF